MSDGIDAGFPLDDRFRGAVVPDPDAAHLARLAARPFPSIDPDARVPALKQRPLSFAKS